MSKINKSDESDNEALSMLNYKMKYLDLMDEIRDAVDEINSSDYSRKALGRFKEKIEKLLYDNL